MKCFVKIRVSGTGVNIEELTERLEIEPIRSYHKGDSFVPAKTVKKPGIYEEDCWIAGIESKKNETVENCVSRFLEILLPHSNYLSKLAQQHNITLWVSAYPDNEQMNFHLSESCMKKLLKIGAALDLSSAFLKDFYEGNY